MIIDVVGTEVQHFSYSHAASCHEFEHDSVSWFGGPEDDFVNGLFFQDDPLVHRSSFEKLAEHWCVARIGKVWFEVVFDEVEKGSEV